MRSAMCGYRNYIVKEGDTVWGIAKAEMGSVALYKEIVERNRLKTATLNAGMVLQLPVGGNKTDDKQR